MVLCTSSHCYFISADSVSSRDLTPSPLYSRPVSRTKSDKSYSSIIEYLRKAGSYIFTAVLWYVIMRLCYCIIVL